jgi:NAD kinase
MHNNETKYNNTQHQQHINNNNTPSQAPADLSDPDLIVTLGGDGTIMHAAHVFSGPVPPILPIAGGSMGFLTPFAREEILDAILIALGMPLQMHSNSNPRISVNGDCHNDRNDYDGDSNTNNNDSYTANGLKLSNRANNNMLVEDITRESYYYDETKFGQRNNAQICISMRMRLDCRIFGSDGTLRSRYNVLNEVVIDRCSSPYLVRCLSFV